jgi:hypothetical protein
MAENKFVKGRQTIRKSASTFAAIDPMKPVDGRPNPRIRLWDFETKPGTTLAKLEAAYLKSIDAVDALADRKANSAQSGKFTPDGLTDDALQYALNAAVPVFKQGRDAIKSARAEVAARREKITLQAPDKSDIAGALLRREIRDRLAGMDVKDRDSFMSENVERMDPVVAEAILTAPAWLSGVAPSHRELLTDKALKAQHGDAIDQIRELERAIEVATSAVETGREAVRLDAGVIDAHQFDKLAAPIEQITAAPWLKKEIENGAEVVRRLTWDAAKNTGSWTKATAADLDAGIFYKDRDAYVADNPGVFSDQNKSAA